MEKDLIPSDLYKFGFQNGMKKKWFSIEKTTVIRQKDQVEDEDKLSL